MKSFLRQSYRVLKYALLVASCFLLSLFFVSLYKARQICAELPNGALIGYTALFDPKQTLWHPYPTLKMSDGTTLIASENYAESFSFTQTTVYGVIGPRWDLISNKNRGRAFVYRPDAGLVIKEEDPALYRKIVEEDRKTPTSPPGLMESYARLLNRPLSKSTRNTLTDIWTTYKSMIANPATRREGCPLNLFPD